MGDDGHVEGHAGVVGVSATLKGTPFVLVWAPRLSGQCQAPPALTYYV